MIARREEWIRRGWLEILGPLRYRLNLERSIQEQESPEVEMLTNQYLMHRIGTFIRSEREKRGESQATFAARAGVHRSTLARLEKGDTGAKLSTFVQALRVIGKGDLLIELVFRDESTDGYTHVK